MHAWHDCQRAALWSQVSSSITAPCGFRGLDSASLPVASTFTHEPSYQPLANLKRISLYKNKKMVLIGFSPLVTFVSRVI